MRSIERRSQSLQKKHPLSGDFCIFAKTIKGKKYTRPVLVKNFTKIVSKDDYAADERKGLIDYLYSLSNPTEESENEAKNRLK